MNPEQCRRILGVAADAGPEAIRQAYLDLARVWHPDRFQSDERLRRIAEEHFQEVNNAYSALKSGRYSRFAADANRTAGAARPASATRPPGPAASTATEDPPYTPPEPAWTPRTPPRPFRQPWQTEPWVQTVLIMVLAAAPFFGAFKIVPLLRVPVFDTDLVASRAFQPRVLTPMSSIDASSDLRSAADALTVWAHGDAVDLWKPAGTIAAPQAHVNSAAPAPRIRPVPKLPVPPPANGADLLPEGRGGAGELHLSNQSNLEAVVKLVNRSRVAVRAVYIAPNASATIHSIGIGVYDLYMDLGHDLDADQLRFASNRFTPTPLGPFQFAEITSETGVSGNRYDVVLNPR